MTAPEVLRWSFKNLFAGLKGSMPLLVQESSELEEPIRPESASEKS